MISGSSGRHGLLLAAASALTLVLAACSGGSGPAPSPTSQSATPTPTPTPSTTVVQRSLLSGRAGAKDGPVLVVKLDNTRMANPHSGMRQADVVYVEEVEGGLTRYAVVYSTEVPTTIGPIRSARISDLELFAQYGKVAFAYSGAQPKLRPVIARANLYDVSGDRGGYGYWRESGRPAPYNFFGNGRQLLSRAPHAAVARDVGFRFATQTPPGGIPVTRVVASYPATRMTFTWSAAEARWLTSMDGQPARATEGGVLGGTTVIIQYVTVVPSGYGDRYGGVTPLSRSVGSGKALVLRDGRAYDVTWQRPNQASGTRFLLGGKDFPLAPGQVWVLLVKNTRPATVTRAVAASPAATTPSASTH